ncbi:Glutathione-dependent formaldehyde-activating, GFA [Devosia sp. LC5]|uniref:GFA family protein n=1 Tax=Devosia sp. LC5 TaxID=1502724 RepID=UPI0004E2C7BC|nr:GFA family protein [Devosia sp. LC5]KFC64338.1 Glutathione-dependent formaldehyde-activating, GFA [Devosia sp. LC5]
MRQTHHGSCHCGAVSFEADVDLSAESRRCNCTYCAKTRYWKSFVGVDDIRLLAGAESLADYRAPDSLWPPDHIHHHFCKTCGVQLYSRGFLEQMGGWFYALNIAVLDGVSPQDFAKVPITYENGVQDKQMEPPEVTSYL